MQRLHPETMLIMLGDLKVFAAEYEKNNNTQQVTQWLRALHGACSPAGMKYSMEKIEELLSIMQHTDPPGHGMPYYIDGIRDMVERELKDCLVLVIDTDKVQYCAPKYPLFGAAVAGLFPDASVDISEAGFCFGAHRYTASVFHLMRVAELGLRGLGKRLHVRLKKHIDFANWQDILNAVDARLTKLRNRRPSAARNRDLTYYSELRLDLTAIRDAYRNHTAHARVRYGEHEAAAAREHVKAIMQRLAVDTSKPTRQRVGG